MRDDGARRSLGDWLRFPSVTTETLLRLQPVLGQLSRRLLDEAVEDHRYAPYLQRQDAEVIRLREDDAIALPDDLDFGAIPGLSLEMVERLSRSRPTTLGAAARIGGITPAALSAVLSRLRVRKAA